jgi:hypothetical protein
MGKASSAKKVARAARAGGRRRPGQRRQLGFPLTIVTIIVAGLALVWYARDTREASAAPRPEDHWHAAYGVYICDAFQAPMTDALQDPVGIHTHQDGVIHIHPFVSASSGANARMRHFFDDTALEVTDERITLPDGTTYEEGQDECDGKSANVRVLRWTNAADALDEKDPSEVITENFDDIRFRRDREAFTIAFVPSDLATDEIPHPESIPTLDNLSDVAPAEGGATTSSTEPQSSSSTVVGDTGTTAPGTPDSSTTLPTDTSSTTAPGSP